MARELFFYLTNGWTVGPSRTLHPACTGRLERVLRNKEQSLKPSLETSGSRTSGALLLYKSDWNFCRFGISPEVSNFILHLIGVSGFLHWSVGGFRGEVAAQGPGAAEMLVLHLVGAS
jgi:hypothetical protein